MTAVRIQRPGVGLLLTAAPSVALWLAAVLVIRSGFRLFLDGPSPRCCRVGNLPIQTFSLHLAARATGRPLLSLAERRLPSMRCHPK